MQDILETITEMGIEPDKIFKVIDSDYENIESEFTRATEIIKPHVEVLLENTFTLNKKEVKGITWKNLKDIAMGMVKKGIIKVSKPFYAMFVPGVLETKLY